MKTLIFLLMSSSLFAYNSENLKTEINENCSLNCPVEVSHLEISDSVTIEGGVYEANVYAIAVKTNGEKFELGMCTVAASGPDELYTKVSDCLFSKF